MNSPSSTVKIVYPSSKIKIEKLSESNTVSCSGEDENSKHPKVYISLKNGVAKCSYCGTIFKKNNE